jgi:hypothetical protein
MDALITDIGTIQAGIIIQYIFALHGLYDIEMDLGYVVFIKDDVVGFVSADANVVLEE